MKKTNFEEILREIERLKLKKSKKAKKQLKELRNLIWDYDV